MPSSNTNANEEQIHEAVDTMQTNDQVVTRYTGEEAAVTLPTSYYPTPPAAGALTRRPSQHHIPLWNNPFGVIVRRSSHYDFPVAPIDDNPFASSASVILTPPPTFVPIRALTTPYRLTMAPPPPYQHRVLPHMERELLIFSQRQDETEADLREAGEIADGLNDAIDNNARFLDVLRDDHKGLQAAKANLDARHQTLRDDHEQLRDVVRSVIQNQKILETGLGRTRNIITSFDGDLHAMWEFLERTEPDPRRVTADVGMLRDHVQRNFVLAGENNARNQVLREDFESLREEMRRVVAQLAPMNVEEQGGVRRKKTRLSVKQWLMVVAIGVAAMVGVFVSIGVAFGGAFR